MGFRKGMAALAAVAALTAVAGCGSESNDSETGSASATAATAASSTAASEPKKARVYILLPSVEDEAYIREKAGAEMQKDKETNAEITIEAGTGRGTADALIQKIQSAVTQGYDAIAVNGGEVANTLIPALKKAADQGVKVLAFDTDLPGVDSKLTYIGWNARQSGELIGGFWNETLPEGGKIGMIRCYAGSPLQDDIANAFKETINSNIKVVSTIDAFCDVAKSRAAAENMMTAHPELKGIMSDTDLGLEGAVQAAQADGKADTLILTGSGASRAVLKSMATGKGGDATTTFPFEHFGAEAVRQAVAAARDEELPPDNVIKPELITKDNAEQVYDEIVAISGP
jgi:ribose transport system substrate-binding protein